MEIQSGSIERKKHRHRDGNMSEMLKSHLVIDKNNDSNKNNLGIRPFFDLNSANEKSCNTDSDEDHSNYEAFVSENCKDVILIRERPTMLPIMTGKRRLLKISSKDISSASNSSISDDDTDKVSSIETDSHGDAETSNREQLNTVEKIRELTLEEERMNSKNWNVCMINNVKSRIDMKVIEPYKRVLSHGGYLTVGSCNAIIILSACYLPHKGRVDYNYVMENLFLYILFTLNQLITDDYVLVYLHGDTAKECIPTFSWLKKYYQMINRKLRKNLKALYLVHPTFWLKTLLLMIKPFISSKFSRKVHFINSLGELYEILPIEEASIPNRVKHYDCLKCKLVSSQ